MDTQKAREIAFKILYELEVRGGSASAELFSHSRKMLFPECEKTSSQGDAHAAREENDLRAAARDFAEAKSFLLHVEDENLGDKASEFVNWIVQGVSENNSNYNKIIEANLKGWKFDRVSKLSLAAIKLALFEIENNEKINDNIAIAEAIKLVAKFEGEEASGFVNGLLGNYIRSK